MTKAAFQGSYADLKFIKTRSVAAITIEIPIEQASAFVAAFGAPTPGHECPVAIARLDTAKAASEGPEPTVDPIAKERRRFNTLPLSQQAGMRCSEQAFWRFLEEMHGFVCHGADGAAAAVRTFCQCASRAELQEGTFAGNEWLRLNSDYELWMRAPE